MDEEELDRVLTDDYVGDVGALSMDELRSKRAECQGLEVGLSYLRRLAQGRLDIAGAEQRRRREGGELPSSDDLVQRLSTTLADRNRPAGNGRLPQLLAPDTANFDTSALDAIAGPGALSRLHEAGDDEVAHVVDELSAYEAAVSRRRRSLHERIDALQAEITRRYRTGEASVETLLS